MYTERLHTLRQIVKAAGVRAIALMPGPNLTYLTGQHFHLMERPVLGLFPAAGAPTFILPQLERSKLDGLPYAFTACAYTDEQGPAGAFERALAEQALAGQWLGVEGLRLRFFEATLLQTHAPGISLSDIDGPLAALRLRKDAAEIAAMRQAIAISEAALRETLAAVRPGMTERQIANRLQIAMLDGGGGALPFEAIVLTGPQSALPHGVPGDRAAQSGDILLIDFGTSHGGYVSDITRTFAIGELVETQLVEAYAAVLAANEAGRDAAGPGVPAQEVDRAARAEIVKAGFGEYFIHRTGHGLGMDAHEGPYIREGNATPLEVGNAFTVEPGVYLPGVGGIRIEDDVVITEDGAESLTTFPRELQSVG